MSIFDYVRDTKGELKHVVWPTRRQALLYTATIIVVSAVFAAALSAIDIGFERLIGIIVSA